MRAAVFEGSGRLAVREVPRPLCPPGGVLLAVEACAVCGTDVRILRHGHAKVAPPRILGHEVAGRVIESDSDRSSVGDRVTVAPAIGCGQCPACRAGRTNRCPDLRTIGYAWDGAFAECLAVPAEAVAQGHLCAIPEDLSAESAALAEPLACCLNGQELVAVDAGDRVVIAGAGPIGILHARLARARGAELVTMIESREERRRVVQQLGLGPVFGSSAELLAAYPHHFDVAIIAASVPDLYREAQFWVVPGGRVSLFAGLPAHAGELPLAANDLHYREVTLVGAHGSTAAHNRAALALIAGGEVSVADLITSRYPLEQAAAAVEAAAAGHDVKIVVGLV